jgi:ribosome biogenesis GTPase / thiamine phosphate phosphatase
MKLEELGWADPFQTAFATLNDCRLAPARVTAAQREHHRLISEHGVFDAQLSGKLRHEAAPGELPVVGDWVAAQLRPDEGSATITACLPRRSALVRKRPERSSAPQVLAANLDVVLLVTSLNRDFNPRRIERTLAVIWEGGAQPVVLLSKLDLCAEATEYREQAEAVALGVPVHAVSAHSGEGMDELARYLQPACTLALIGSSGVGKSTLVNALLGRDQLATADVRASDDRGRHTTTHRELFVLPGGALLIDTPGLRELGLWDAGEGLDAAFEDVEALAASCRFGDCRHGSEPGCAIRAALHDGTLDADRYANHLKLQREIAYEERRRDPRALLEYRQQARKVFRARKRMLRGSPKKH